MTDVNRNTDIRYVFVHGLSGWGSYDRRYRFFPYWGMRDGDLIGYLRERGYPSYAASVDPVGSAWDRACELYAQLFGKVTDYGAEHSARAGHGRFGRDFTSEPLIPDIGRNTKLVLLGHSFGGVTVRLFAELMANGSDRERSLGGGNGISDLFAGGRADMVHSVVTLAAPTNGTTAYDLFLDPGFDTGSVKIPVSDRLAARVFRSGRKTPSDARAAWDSAAHDMHIDRALELNRSINTLPGTYYFAVPCSASERNDDGTYSPVRSDMVSLYRRTSALMGAYSGSTAGGFRIGEEWRENDGLVNTVSAREPIGAPVSPESEKGPEKGTWTVLPVQRGDHMSLQGGLGKRRNIRPFYTELLDMISSLEN